MKPTFVERCELVCSKIPAAGSGLWHTSVNVIVAEVDVLVDLFYAMPDNMVGGNLHIVLDDSNWEDDHIEHCIHRAKENKDKEAVALGRLLLAMTMKQRLQLKCVCKCGCCDDLKKEVGLL